MRDREDTLQYYVITAFHIPSHFSKDNIMNLLFWSHLQRFLLLALLFRRDMDFIFICSQDLSLRCINDNYLLLRMFEGTLVHPSYIYI